MQDAEADQLRRFVRANPDAVRNVRRSQRDYFHETFGGTLAEGSSATQWAEQIAGTGMEHEVLTMLRASKAREIMRAADGGAGHRPTGGGGYAGEDDMDPGMQAPSSTRSMMLMRGGDPTDVDFEAPFELGGGGAGGGGVADVVGDDCFGAGDVDLQNEELHEMLFGEEAKMIRDQDNELLYMAWEQERELREMDEFWREMDSEMAVVTEDEFGSGNKSNRGRGRGRGRGTNTRTRTRGEGNRRRDAMF